MTKRRLLRWSLIVLLLAAFALWLEPTRQRGQAFGQGGPPNASGATISGGVIAGKFTTLRQAWEKAGFAFGWMNDRTGFPSFRHESEPKLPEDVPGFRLQVPWKSGILSKLASPPLPFGVDLSFPTWSGEGLYEVPNDGMKEIARFENLHVLEVTCPNLTAAGLKHLAALKKLESLSMISAKLGDAELSELGRLSNLRKLVLFECQIPGTDLHLLKNLRSLDLTSSEVSAAGWKRLAELENLVDVSIEIWQAADIDIKRIASLTRVRNVKLHLFRDLDAILPKLASVANLRSLNLFGSNFTGAGMIHLSKLQGLRSLNLSSCDVTKRLQVIGGLVNLEELKLRQAVTDDDLKELSQLKNLRKLDIANGDVSDEGLKHLRTLTKLEYLDLAGTSVTDTGIAELLKALPKLQVNRKSKKRETAAL